MSPRAKPKARTKVKRRARRVMKQTATIDAINGGGRTGYQVGFPGAVISMLASFQLIHWNEQQTTGVLLVSAIVFTAVQRYMERRTGSQGFLFRR